jgi:7-dehydrocholesterol reductase
MSLDNMLSNEDVYPFLRSGLTTMKRQKATNGQVATQSNGFGDKVKATNGIAAKHSSSLKTEAPDNNKTKPGDCSRIQHFFLRTFVPLFLMVFSPNLVILLWYTAVKCNGSFLRLGEILLADGLYSGISRIWTDIHIASPIAVAVIIGYMVWALVLMVMLPGPRVEGPVTPNGNTPVYRDNGFACYTVTMLAFVMLAILLPRYTPYSVTIVYDHFDEFLGTLTVFTHLLCISLHIKGLLWPSTTDCGTSGNLVFDYFWGTELYPRIAGIDIKVFTNCRFGMTVWPLLVAIFTLKSYELHGFIDSVWVSAALQMIYFTKFFWWESGYMRTIDIMLDRAGFYICWGCLCYVPGLYASVSMYLASRTITLGTFWSAVILVLGVASCIINYAADRQKLEVRRTNAQCLVWGRRPDVIRAKYTLSTGDTRTSLLLVSGYWGLARHFHYVPELVLAFLWTVPALFDNVMPYSYVIWLVLLLVHRTFRDDTKCHDKYGEHWKEYCRRVPYKMIPYVF